MIEINVSAETAQLSRTFNNLSKSAIARATSEAINRTLLRGRSDGRREVKKRYNIPNRYLNYVDIKRSKVTTLTGNIHARTIPLPMDAFNPRFQAVSAGKIKGVTSITRRGTSQTALSKGRGKRRLGVSIEVVKGRRTSVLYAFLLPGNKSRVFARGDYTSGGNYSFIKRHKREENSSGNDRVTNLLSVTVYGALINDKVINSIEGKLLNTYPVSLHNALMRRVKL